MRTKKETIKITIIDSIITLFSSFGLDFCRWRNRNWNFFMVVMTFFAAAAAADGNKLIVICTAIKYKVIRLE